MTDCTLAEPCARCRDQRDPGAPSGAVPVAPGPVGAWLLNGWWHARNAPRWWARGLSHEVGPRVCSALVIAARPAPKDSEGP